MEQWCNLEAITQGDPPKQLFFVIATVLFFIEV